jgi:toxin ParE1/3/4
LSGYKLSNKALEDLLDIISYTFDTWGVDQTQTYRNELYECCDLIGKTPGVGRACDPLGFGLRRITQGSHVIFYKAEADLVIVSRILHRKVMPKNEYFVDT